MAEFLVHKQLDWQLIRGVATMAQEVADQVKEILGRFGQKTAVAVKREGYY